MRGAIGLLFTLAFISLLVGGCKKKQDEQQGAAPAKAAQPATAAPAQAAQPAQAAAPAKFDTPKAVFDAAKAAVEGKEYGKFVDCVQPNSRKEMAAGMVVVLGFMTMMEKSAKPEVEALLKKHEMPDAGAMRKWKGDQQQKMAKLAESIKDPRALVLDTMALMDKIMEKQQKKSGKPASPRVIDGELVDVKTEGDKAKGQMKLKKGKSKPVDFVKVDGSWYLDISLQ